MKKSKRIAAGFLIALMGVMALPMGAFADQLSAEETTNLVTQKIVQVNKLNNEEQIEIVKTMVGMEVASIPMDERQSFVNSYNNLEKEMKAQEKNAKMMYRQESSSSNSANQVTQMARPANVKGTIFTVYVGKPIAPLTGYAVYLDKECWESIKNAVAAGIAFESVVTGALAACSNPVGAAVGATIAVYLAGQYFSIEMQFLFGNMAMVGC